MNNYYRVSHIVNAGKKCPANSILAREKGIELHKLIANQYQKQGNYVETNLSVLLVDDNGKPATVLVRNSRFVYVWR